MTRAKFQEILNKRLELTKEVLNFKADEYADEDQFHNFKEAAQIKGETPEQALWGMSVKHLVSIKDIINGKSANNALISEKIGDMINYLIILEGILYEKNARH